MDKRAVYFYTLPGETACAGLAFNMHIYNGSLRFFDTIRGHEIPDQVIKEDDNVFTSTGYRPEEWRFNVLTVEDFRRDHCKMVKDREALATVIKSTEDLWEWYRTEYE